MADFQPIAVCDTCVFIDLMTGDDDDRAALDKVFFNDAKSGLLRVGVSEVTVAETARLKSKDDDVLSLVEGFLANAYMRRMPTTPAVSWRASVLIRFFKLETCDAIIVATALTHDARTFYTRDEDSLCKRIRSSQNAPRTLKNLPKPDARFPSENEVLDELDKLQIVPLSLVKPVPSPLVIAPVAPVARK